MRRNMLATLCMLAMIASLPGNWAKGQYESSDPQARLAGLESADNRGGYAEATSDSAYDPQPLGRPAVYKMTDPATMTNCCNADGNCCTSCNSGCGSCQSNCCSNSCCSNGGCSKGCGCGIGGLFGGADPVGGFVGGFEYVWFRPFASNGDLPNANFGVAGGAGVTDRTLNFNYQVTPRIFLGYVGASGLGGRVRYWQYDHGGGTNSTTDTNPNSGTFGDTATIAGGFKFQTFDIELTQQSSFRAWNFLMAGGVRYASFAADSTNAVVDPLGAPIGFSRLTNSISGTGLTTAFQARRALNATGSLVWLTNLRGSLLFGNHRSSVYQNVTIPLVGTFTTISNSKNRDDLFSIWEINLGPQWHMPLANGGRLFVGATAEAQLWQGLGGYSYNSGGANTQANGVALGSLGLVGFGGNIGITR